ncbi:hypothetical protein ACIO14_30250 [Nocardia fluminea]
MKALDVTHRSATLNIEKLVEAGILVEVTRARTRFFAAPDVLAVMNGT